MKNFKNKVAELKKHVSTIHCANALTLLQRKIANALLYHAYDDLLLQDEYEISIRELCVLIGYDSHDYKSIKRALVELLSTVIQWNIIDEGLPESEGEWNASSIIADASIKGSICTYSYSKRMKQLLYMPVIYGRLNMRIMSQFKSSYGLALYENVIRYQNLAQTPWFKIEVFRKLMGVPEDKYLIFRDFKRRVIDKAISEVNTIAAVNITIDMQKQSRCVVALRFLIEKKKTERIIQKSDSYTESLQKKLLIEYGLNSTQINILNKKYTEDYILEKVSLIEATQSFQHGKIVNLGKYLLQALQDNYQKPKASSELVRVKRVEEVKDLYNKKQSEEKTNALKKAYSEYVNKYINSKINTLPISKRHQLISAFEEHLKNIDILNRRYKKDGLNNKIIFMEFKSFIQKNFSFLMDALLPFNDFMNKQISQ